MNSWRDFFVQNQIIILFIYGQVFFLLGLAIVWQSRRHSRLSLARSLGWLGLFGLTHGLHEWGDIFIPIQAGYLTQSWIDLLLLLQLCLLALSFGCLFQFGVETVQPRHAGWLWLRVLPAGLLLAWMVAFLWASQVLWLNSDELMTWANIWARYLLGFFGALAAALALHKQARAQSLVPEFSQVARPFFVASAALVAYALLAGLMGPPSSFFPANVINAELLITWLGVPVQLLRSLAGLVLVIAITRGLTIFEVEVDHRLEAMEQAHILQIERERVSRELHDGAVQTVYTAGLMVESIRKKVGSHDPLSPRLDRAISALQQAIRDLRHFITELEPDAPGENLADGLNKLASDPHLQTFIAVELNINYQADQSLTPTRTSHVLAIVQEAFNNVIRHARASHILAVAERVNGQLQITVTDDGQGLPAEHVAGFGLRNMRDRARLLGGSLRLEPGSPRGTRVTLSIPWEDSP